MRAHLETILCKFGRNRAICVVVEAICAKCLQIYGETDDGRRAIVLAHALPNQSLHNVFVNSSNVSVMNVSSPLDRFKLSIQNVHKLQ